MTCLPYFGVGKVLESGIQIPLAQFSLSQPQLLISYIWCEISDTFAAFSESKDKCLLVGTQWWVGGHQWCDQWWAVCRKWVLQEWAVSAPLERCRVIFCQHTETHKNKQK